MENQLQNIHGKNYELVASRINRFRNDRPEWSITTEIIKHGSGECIIKASILDEKGVVRATGIAHEKESGSTINKTSYVECCESSAIGRCLACFNYQGGEYASADEVAQAIKGQSVSKSEETFIPDDRGNLDIGKIVCNDCSSPILTKDGAEDTKVIEYSKSKYNVPVCWTCQQKRKSNG